MNTHGQALRCDPTEQINITPPGVLKYKNTERSEQKHGAKGT